MQSPTPATDGARESRSARDGGTDTRNAAVMTDAPRYDAGMRDLDHYASKLPKWRYNLRQRLIPIVRSETPYLALFQEKCRTSALDSYFAFTANLGTHTFFMIMLPILFWCGFTNVGRAMVHVLAAGVFFTGFVKDMLCLPRPLSPPLQRITMSGSAALEYGFPSTHSANAVSVAVYAIASIRSNENISNSVRLALELLFYCYASSIVIGRLYCGMHGFFDVIIGSLMGAAIAAVQLLYEEVFDQWIATNGYLNPLIATLICLVLVRVHPEPADDCPCFDDSISFVGVTAGIQIGYWHYANTGMAWDKPIPGTVPFDFEEVGLFKSSLRIILGVVIIFLWRGVAKPTLLKTLPTLMRFITKIGLENPRKFFLRASSQYSSVPHLQDDDNVIPPASEIPHLLTQFRHPRQRAVSIGPQSAADAYETIAYRHKRRRESLSSTDGRKDRSPVDPKSPATLDSELDATLSNQTSSNNRSSSPLGVDLLPSPVSSRVHSYERMMGTGTVGKSLITPPESVVDVTTDDNRPNLWTEEEEKEEREMFLKIEKPRVRYDVEVVTKLIVYSGIAWLAVEGNPLLFEYCGLGMN